MLMRPFPWFISRTAMWTAKFGKKTRCIELKPNYTLLSVSHLTVSSLILKISVFSVFNVFI